jgi:hypothetical protein
VRARPLQSLMSRVSIVLIVIPFWTNGITRLRVSRAACMALWAFQMS